MFSHHLGRALAIASALLLSACKSFSPDGGMSAVADVAGGGLNKNVVRISSAADASLARSEVARLLHAPLGADAAVQIALLNNAGLQAAYNRLGVAEAVMVQASRPPLPSFSYDWVKTSIELDVERQIVASILSLATWPARSKLAGVALRAGRASRRRGDVASRGGNATRLYPRGRCAPDPDGAQRRQGKCGILGELEPIAHRDRRGQQARSCQAAGVRHRDGGASDGGAAASRRHGGAAHAAVGTVGNRPRRRVCRTRCPRFPVMRAGSARSSRRRWTGASISPWRGSKPRRWRAPSGSRARRVSSTCSTPPASPRRRRTRASLRPMAAATTSPSRCRSTISAERACARPSSVISRR